MGLSREWAISQGQGSFMTSFKEERVVLWVGRMSGEPFILVVNTDVVVHLRILVTSGLLPSKVMFFYVFVNSITREVMDESLWYLVCL